MSETRTSHAIEWLTIDDVRCLISWREGSIGYRNEEETLEALLELCCEVGYGRLAQLAAQIEAIWRDPSSRAEFEETRRQHLEVMEDMERHYKEKP